MYYRPSNLRRGGNKGLYIVTALALLVLLADMATGGFIRAQVRVAGAAASRWTAAAGSAIGGTGLLSSRAALEAQNRSLALQLATLSEEAAQVDVLKEENDKLRAMVHLAEKDPGITTPVISSLFASPYGTFMIGAGSEDGVEKGDIVLTDGGFVVGEVSDVSASVSLVTEILAPSAAFEALVSGAPIHAEGAGSGSGRAEVSRSLGVSVGDVIRAAQYAQQPIAIVGAIASTSESATQTIYFHLPTGLSEIQYIYVTQARR